MTKNEDKTASSAGNDQYIIRVSLNTLLSEDQVTDLVAALQEFYDDGTAGGFFIESTGTVSVATFYRQMADDCEVIQQNIANGKIIATDAESAVVTQLSMELSEQQAENPYVREIVAALQGTGITKPLVGNLDPFRNMLTME